MARSDISAESLMQKVMAHLRAFKALYGDSVMTPKFHYGIHLAWQYKQHGLLVACFMHERKHKVLK
eukprot:8443996-Alexandrium_andersonii.AAC.1